MGINHTPEHKQLEHFDGQLYIFGLPAICTYLHRHKQTTTIKYSIIESDEFFSHDLIKKQTT